MLGVVQFALDNGIQNIVGVYDAAMARLYRRCGFTTIELARFRTAEHGTVYAGLCPISKSLEASVLAATALLPESANAPDRLRRVNRSETEVPHVAQSQAILPGARAYASARRRGAAAAAGVQPPATPA